MARRAEAGVTPRRWVLAAGLAAWLILVFAWSLGAAWAWLSYALAALTLLLAFELVTLLSRRVRARWRGKNGDV